MEIPTRLGHGFKPVLESQTEHGSQDSGIGIFALVLVGLAFIGGLLLSIGGVGAYGFVKMIIFLANGIGL